MKRQDKRVPWWALGIGLAAFAIIAFMLIQRQNNDLAMLERTYDNVNAKRMVLQYEQSELQRELSISTTSDYIASRARENGYMMPNELHFVVDNPEVLTDHGTLGDIQLSTVETPAADTAAEETAAQPVQTEAENTETEPVQTDPEDTEDQTVPSDLEDPVDLPSTIPEEIQP